MILQVNYFQKLFKKMLEAICGCYRTLGMGPWYEHVLVHDLHVAFGDTSIGVTDNHFIPVIIEM